MWLLAGIESSIGAGWQQVGSAQVVSYFFLIYAQYSHGQAPMVDDSREAAGAMNIASCCSFFSVDEFR